MKTIFSFLAALCVAVTLNAQKVEYKDGLIKVDGKDVAKVVKTKDKENLGLTSTYEILSMSGEQLIIAAYAGEFEQDPNNTMDYYYRLTFMTADQIGIFAVSKLGTEKDLAKTIGKAGIIVDDKLDAQLVKVFIAKKGKSPKIAIDYTMVGRDRAWPINLKKESSIEQQSKTIGTFKDVTVKSTGMDTYEFMLPSGVKIAKVSFTGGNNAQNCEMHTMKDNLKRVVPITDKHKVEFVAWSVDRNEIVLERIVKWLVSNQYL